MITEVIAQKMIETTPNVLCISFKNTEFKSAFIFPIAFAVKIIEVTPIAHGKDNEHKMGENPFKLWLKRCINILKIKKYSNTVVTNPNIVVKIAITFKNVWGYKSTCLFAAKINTW